MSYLNDSKEIDKFYIVMSSQETGEGFKPVVNYSPGTQKFLRTYEEAVTWKKFLDVNQAETKHFLLPIEVIPYYDMIWPEGFKDMISFGKAFQRVKKEEKLFDKFCEDSSQQETQENKD